jgi:hypothetical protein
MCTKRDGDNGCWWDGWTGNRNGKGMVMEFMSLFARGHNCYREGKGRGRKGDGRNGVTRGFSRRIYSDVAWTDGNPEGGIWFLPTERGVPSLTVLVVLSRPMGHFWYHRPREELGLRLAMSGSGLSLPGGVQHRPRGRNDSLIYRPLLSLVRGLCDWKRRVSEAAG